MMSPIDPQPAGAQARGAIDVDFLRSARVASALGWLLLCAGVIASAVVALDHADARAALGQVLQRQARLERQLRAPTAVRAPAPASAGPGGAAPDFAQLQSQLASPWDDPLRALEAHRNPAVALLAIDAQAQRLRLVGEARDMDAVVAWLEGLRGSPSIAAADLSGHEMRQDGDIGRLRFTVDMRWRVAP